MTRRWSNALSAQKVEARIACTVIVSSDNLVVLLLNGNIPMYMEKFKLTDRHALVTGGAGELALPVSKLWPRLAPRS